MALAAQMICSMRSADRLSVDLDATLRDATARPIAVEIENISVTGFRMLTSTDLPVGELITVGISGLGMLPAIVVRHDDSYYGCRFVTALSQAAVDALLVEPQMTVMPFPRADQHPPVTRPRDAADLRYSKGTRLAIILGLSTACWVALGAVAVLLFF